MFLKTSNDRSKQKYEHHSSLEDFVQQFQHWREQTEISKKTVI